VNILHSHKKAKLKKRTFGHESACQVAGDLEIFNTMLTANRQDSVMKDTIGQTVWKVTMQIDEAPNDVVTTQQAAKMTGYHERYIRAMCDEGKLIAIKYGERWWIDASSLPCTSASGLPF